MDIHGASCNWEFSPLVARELRSTSAGFLIAATNGSVDHAHPTESSFQLLLDTPVSAFAMSARASNCLRHANLHRIRDLVVLSHDKIASLKNLGRTTADELRGLLSMLGLRFGITDFDLREISRSYKSDLDGLRQINIHLLRNIDTIGCGHLTGRIIGVHTVGELIRTDRSSLANQLPAEDLRAIEVRLKELGVGFGTRTEPWQQEDFSELVQIFSRDLLRFEAEMAQFLEVELQNRIKTRNQRNRDIAVRYFGFDGQPAQTLDQVGKEFGLTRERIRQIVDKIRCRLGNTLPGALRAAIRTVEQSCPCAASDVQAKLNQLGITTGYFDLVSLRKIADLFGAKYQFSVIEVGSSSAVVDLSSANFITTILSEAQRRISQFGATSVTQIAATLRLEGSVKSRATILDMLPLLPGLIWLDDCQEWFWSREVPRNPILDRIRKVFAVANGIRGEELLHAVQRDGHLDDVSLPLDVFERFCGSCSKHIKAENGIISHDFEDLSGELSDGELAAFLALRDHPAAIRRSHLRVISAGLSQYSDSTLERIISTSPIIKSVGDGYYTLAGRNADAIAKDPSPGKPVTDQVEEYPPPNLETCNRSILFDLNPASRHFVWDAAVLMVARAKSSQLVSAGRPWSLIELNWTSDDLVLLHKWASVGSVENFEARASQRRMMTARQAVALIFLLYCFDVARQHAMEGEIWPSIYSAIGLQLKSELFSGNRAVPKYWLLESTEEVCRQFNIRHHFGTEGAMGWLRTVFLQFGFTKHGIERFPELFSGAKLPVTIADLLSDANLQSEEFCNGWTEIQKFRQGIESSAALKRALSVNPWFSAHNLDHLVTVAAETVASDLAEEEENDGVSALFITRVLWTGPEPMVSVQLPLYWPTEFQASEYAMQCGNQYRTTIRRTPDGSYSPNTFTVPLTDAQLRIAFFERGEQIGADWILSIFGTDDELMFFDRSKGSRQDLWNFDTSRPCILSCRADVVVQPAGVRTRRVADNNWTVHDFPSGCPAGLQIELEGELMWQVPVAGHRRNVQQPDAEIRLHGGKIGEYSEAEILTQPGLRPVSLVIGGQIIRQSSNGFRVLLTPLNYDRVRAGVLVSDGKSLRKVRARVRLIDEVWGAAIRKQDGDWDALDADKCIERGKFVRTKMLLRPPRYWAGASVPEENWALMEGASFCARSRRNGIVGLDTVLAGLGEPLRLLLGPYNSFDSGIQLALSVIDTGILEGVALKEGRYTLSCSHTLDFGPDHSIWVWKKGEHEPRMVVREDILCRGNELDVAINGTPVAFALGFRKRCLGSRFVDVSWAQAFKEILSMADWVPCARWMRWWRVPLLHIDLHKVVADYSAKQRLATFLAWTAEMELQGMPYNDESFGAAGWAAVVREVFWNWIPDEFEAETILRETGLLSGDPERDLAVAWSESTELASVNPVLLVSIVKRGLPLVYRNSSEIERRLLLSFFANTIAGLPKESGALDTAKAALFDRAVAEMGTDPAFVRRVLWTEALNLYHGKEKEARNLRVAVAVQPFRRWLALELLDLPNHI